MKLPPLAKRHAFVLEGATVFPNPVGLVPGMVLEHQGSTIVLLPGVPQELQALLQDGVLAYIKERFKGRVRFEQVLQTFGVVESKIAPRVVRICRRYPGVSVGFYPAVSGVDILLRSEDKNQLPRCVRDLKPMLKAAVYATSPRSFPQKRESIGKKELAEIVGELLRTKKLTIATAESCTGGLIGDLLTNVPGSSGYYQGGVVAYSNQTKMSLLGVQKKTLNRYGAVSAQTVREMGEGICRLIGADVGIAVSGIAGPTGGTKSLPRACRGEKPVGLVYIGVALKGRVKIERHIFSGNRRMIKERSAYTALDLCRRTLGALRPTQDALRRKR